MTYPMQSSETPGAPADIPYVGALADYRLPQPGGRPNVFKGTELAMAMSFTAGLPYWYEINLYRTQEQTFVVAIRQFFTAGEKEDIVKSWPFNSVDEALAIIENYDAAADVAMPEIDFEKTPPAELSSHAMMLKAEVEAARAHYAGLVGELLAEIESAGVVNA